MRSRLGLSTDPGKRCKTMALPQQGPSRSFDVLLEQISVDGPGNFSQILDFDDFAALASQNLGALCVRNEQRRLDPGNDDARDLRCQDELGACHWARLASPDDGRVAAVAIAPFTAARALWLRTHLLGQRMLVTVAHACGTRPEHGSHMGPPVHRADRPLRTRLPSLLV